jgi:hypothetical protein
MNILKIFILNTVIGIIKAKLLNMEENKESNQNAIEINQSDFQVK